MDDLTFKQLTELQERRKREKERRLVTRRFLRFLILSAASVALFFTSATVMAAITGRSVMDVARQFVGINEATVTITATPQGYVSGLTATYVADNSVRLDWSINDPATSVVIMAKYDAVPATPTDGYLIYSGSGGQAYDSALNLNETFSTIHYVAFPFDIDDELLPLSMEATMESPHMAELSTSITGISTLISGTVIILFLTVMAYWHKDPLLYMASGFALLLYAFFELGDTRWLAILVGLIGVYGFFKAIWRR